MGGGPCCPTRRPHSKRARPSEGGDAAHRKPGGSPGLPGPGRPFADVSWEFPCPSAQEKPDGCAAAGPVRGGALNRNPEGWWGGSAAVSAGSCRANRKPQSSGKRSSPQWKPESWAAGCPGIHSTPFLPQPCHEHAWHHRMRRSGMRFRSHASGCTDTVASPHCGQRARVGARRNAAARVVATNAAMMPMRRVEVIVRRRGASPGNGSRISNLCLLPPRLQEKDWAREGPVFPGPSMV